MTRLGIYALLLLGIAGLLIAAAMRYEHAAPGLSSAAVWIAEGGRIGDGTQPEDIYIIAASAHRVGMIMLGLLLAAAVLRGALPGKLGRVLFCIPLVLALFYGGSTLLATFLPDRANAAGLIFNPWLFDPVQALTFNNPDRNGWTELLQRALSDQVQLCAIWALCLVGLLLRFSSSGNERRCIAVIAALILCVLAFQMTLDRYNGTQLELVLVIPVLAALALVSFVSSDDDRFGGPHLFVGLALTIGAMFWTHGQGVEWRLSVLSETVWRVGRSHLTLLAVPMMSVLVLADMRYQPAIPRSMVWGHALAVGIALVACFGPLLLLGNQGMLVGYADYPDPLEKLNFASSNGYLILVILYAIGLWIMRRHRTAPQPLRRLHQAAPLKSAGSPQAA